MENKKKEKEYHRTDIKFVIDADYTKAGLRLKRVLVESQIEDRRYSLPLDSDDKEEIVPLLLGLSSQKNPLPAKQELEALEAMRFIAIATHSPLQAIREWKNRDETKVTSSLWKKIVEKYIYNRINHCVAERKPESAKLGGILAAKAILEDAKRRRK